MTGLTTLNIARNPFTTLPAGIFDSLTSLTDLLIFQTEGLRSLPEGIFEPLTRLTTLRLEKRGNVSLGFRPTANAGADQSVSLGAGRVTLAGTATGPWGNNVTWGWTQVDGANSNTAVSSGTVTLANAATATPSFTAPSAAATLHFRLIVTPVPAPRPGTAGCTGCAVSEADWVTITVSDSTNQAPTVANAIPDQAATVDTAFEYIFPTNTFNDADGDSLTYTAMQTDGMTDSALPTWLSFTAAERKFTIAADAGEVGTVMVKVTASDGNGGTISDTFNIVVSAADTAPAFADSATIMDKTFTVDGEITAFTLPEASGGNGTISYALTPDLPTGLSLNESTREVSGTPTAAAAQATYTWRASDSDANTADSDTAALTFSLTVNKATLAAPTGLALKANSKTRTGFTITWTAVANATGYKATARASGQPDKTVTLSTAPTNPEAVFTGLAMDTTYTVTVIATGNANYDNSPVSNGQSVTTLANSAPTVANAIADQTATVGVAFSYAFPANSFNDADGDSLTYTAMQTDGMTDSALPTWLSFTAAERKFTIAADAGEVGTVMVKVTASDGNGGTISDTFNIVVSTADTAPAFADSATITDKTFTVDGEITAFTLPEASGGNGTISYALTPDLPTGLSLNESTREVSGTPTAAAAQATYTWRASDSDANTADSDTAALTFSLTVNKATLAAPTGLALKANSKTSTGFTITWTAVSNAAGYAASAMRADGTGTAVAVTVSGTTTEAVFTSLTAGTAYKVTVTATGDANYANSPASAEFDVSTAADSAPAFADSETITDKTFTVDGEITAFTLPEASGGNGTISYALTPDLPTGLSLNESTREVSGTPTAAAAQATYTWRASDSDANTADSDTAALTFSLTVNKATLAAPTGLALKANSKTSTGFTITWTAVSNAAGYAASAMRADGTGTAVAVTVSGTTTEAVFTGLTAGTAYKVTVTATGDANYANSPASAEFDVSTLANSVPTVANAIPDQAATVDTAFEYIFPTNTFNDTDGDSLTYTAMQTDGMTDSALPTWLSFTAAERKFTIAADAGEVGTVMVKVTASDGNGGTISDTFNIVVSTADTAPAFADSATITDKTFTVDGEITAFTLPEASGGNGTISYALTPDLPTGLSLNESTREVSGTPTAAAAQATYTWRASDSDANTADSDTAALTFSLTVNKATLAAPTGLALKANSKTSTGFTITWTAVSNAAGYAASAMRADGTGTAVDVTVSGTTTEAVFTGLTAGTAYKVTVTATGDANYANSPASAEFDVSTLANSVPNSAPMVANAIPDQVALVGVAFSYVFPTNTFNDPDGDTLTYTVSKADDSVRPDWLDFTDSTRSFEGTPPSSAAGRLSLKVTASDGKGRSVSDTFDILVSPPLLEGLALALPDDTAVTLTPAFSGATKTYTATVPDGTALVDLTPTASSTPSGITVTVDGVLITSGAAKAVTLFGASTEVRVVARKPAPNPQVDEYLVTIAPQNPPASEPETLLSALRLKSGDLVLTESSVMGTDPTIIAYRVPSDVTSLRVTPTVATAGATVTVNGKAVASGAPSASIPLGFGVNTIVIVVTSPDGMDSRTYRANVQRQRVATLGLSALTLATGTLEGTTFTPVSTGILNPSFSPGVLEYQVVIDRALDSLRVTPTVNTAGATVTVNGTAVTSGSASGVINLATGRTDVTIVVTAAGGATATYRIQVYRPAEAATVTSIELRAVAPGEPPVEIRLDPGFNGLTYTYRTQNPIPLGRTLEVKVRARYYSSENEGSSPIINGRAATQLQWTPVPLDFGESTFSVSAVRFGSIASVGQYDITVVKTHPAALSGLMLSAGTLRPAFDPAVLVYRVTLPRSVSAFTVTPQSDDPALRTRVGETPTVAAAPVGTPGAPVSLTVGETRRVLVYVRGDDQTGARSAITPRTYQLRVTRSQTQGSSDASLSALALDEVELAEDNSVNSLNDLMLTPAFATETTNYALSVPPDFKLLRVRPTTTDDDATFRMSVNGQVVDPRSQISLQAGSSELLIRVTAADGATDRSYRIVVTRRSSATLDALGLRWASPGTNEGPRDLNASDFTVVNPTPAFAAGTASYTASVPYEATLLRLNPRSTDPAASVTVNGEALNVFGSSFLSLVPGGNRIALSVQAADGISRMDYTLLVTRANPPSGQLSLSFANQPRILVQAGATMASVTLPAATGGTAPYSYDLVTGAPSWLSLNSGTRALTGTAPAGTGSDLVSVQVTDADGATATASFNLVRAALAFGVVMPLDRVFTVGQVIDNLVLPAASGGTGTVTYTLTPDLPAGLTFTSSTRTLSGTPTAAAITAVYTYLATDSASPTANTAQLKFSLTLEENRMPSFGTAAVPDQVLVRDELAPSLRLPAASSGNAPLTYALSPATPAGLAFNAATRTLGGTPTAAAAAADYTLTVTDADGQTATLTFRLEVRSQADSAPLLPVDSALPDRVWTKGAQVAPITLPTATGGDGALTYALTPSLPMGLSFNAATRTISGTPSIAAPRQIYTYSVTDSDSNTASSDGDQRRFAITVSAPLAYPAVPAKLQVGTAMRGLLPIVTGGDGTPTYTLTGTLPAGLGLNANTGIIGGTPSAVKASTSTITVTVTVGGQSASEQLTFPAVTAKPTAVSGLTVTPLSDTELFVQWTAATVAPDGYWVRWRENQAGQRFVARVETTQTNYRIEGLRSGTAYLVRVDTLKIDGRRAARTAQTATSTTNTKPGSTEPVLDYAPDPTKLVVGQTIDRIFPEVRNFAVGAVITYSVASGTLPPGLSLNAETGVISGAPDTPNSKSVVVAFRATAGEQQTAPHGILFPAVERGLRYPSIPGPLFVDVGITPLAPIASGFTGELTFRAITNPPSGILLNTETGVISGAPNRPNQVPQEVIVDVTVQGTMQRAIYTLSFPPVQPTPALRYAGLPVPLQVGASVSLMPIVASSFGTVTSYALSGTLPAGLSFNTGTGVISGMPDTPAQSVDEQGVSVTVTATTGSGDSQKTATARVDFQPVRYAPPTIAAIADITSLVVGVSQRVPVTLSGVPGGATSAIGAAIGGVETDGTFSVNSIAVGTVGTDSITLYGLRAGTETVTVTATVGEGVAASREVRTTFQLTVTDAALTAEAGDPPTSTAVGTAVTLTGSARGGVPGVMNRMASYGYAWTVVSEPTGSSVSISDADKASASFTPTHDGTYQLRLTVTDSATPTANTATDTVDVVVPTSSASLAMPTGLMATKLVNGFTVNWTAVPGATEYEAYVVRTDLTTTARISATKVSGTSADWVSLNPAATYRVSVIAKAGGLANSAAGTLENVMPGVPPAGEAIKALYFSSIPGDLTGTYQLGEQIQITIKFKSPVALDSMVGKRPSIGLQVGDKLKQVSLIDVGDATTLVASYFVKAGDRDADGVSIAANAISLNGGKITSASDSTMNMTLTHAALPTDPRRKVDSSINTNPNAPSAPTLTGSTYGSLDVPFDVVVTATDADGGGLLYYAGRPVANAEVLDLAPTSSNKSELVSGTSVVTVTPRRAGRSATFRVFVEDDGVPRKFSSAAFEVFVAGLSYPAAAALQVGTAITDLMPTHTNFETGSTITYAVTGGTLPAGLNLASGTGIISGTPTAEATAPVTVTATGTKTDGGSTRTQTAKTIVVFPGTPRTAVTNLSLTASARGEVTATWTAASYAPSGYKLRWRKTGTVGYASGDEQTLAGSATTATITGLDDATEYRVRIDTLAADGTSLVSDTGVTKDITTSDGPSLSYPALPTVLRAGVQFETLTPTPAGFQSGSTYTYAVTDGTLPSGLKINEDTGTISGEPDTPTPTNGSSGASVTVTVTGSTGTGESKQTETATATLDFPRIFRFKLPAPTVTLEVGDTQLTANWDAVANADTYVLQWKASSVTSWTAVTGVTTVDPATPGTVITGLTNGTSYDVRVRSKAASSSTTHVDGDWSGGVQGMPAVDATFSVTGPATVVEDAGTATYTVTLSKQPAVDVTVKYTTGDGTATAGSDYTAKSDTLTFTTGSWDTAQTVDVTITNDSLDEDDETFTFTLSEPSSGSKLSSSSTVMTTITDNDTRGVTLSETTLTVDEGDSETYTVVLASQPTGNVTVTPTVPENTDISVSPASLTFTNSDWDSPQTVTMAAAEDTDTDTDPAVTITHTVAGADYASVTAGSVTVTVNDDDQSLTYPAAPTSLTVGVSVNLTATASGFGSATVAYTVTSTAQLPAGLNLNSSTGAITGMPTAASTTTTTVTVTATAGTGMDTQTATANITFPAIGKGTLATPANLALKANTQRKTSFTVSWTAVTNATGYTATATPSGGTAVTGAVTGTEATFTGLTAGTTYTVSVVATGNTANYENSTAAMLNQATAANVAPSIVDITNKTATFGTNLLVDVDATDTNPEDTLQYQASSGAEAVATVSPTSLTDLGTSSQITVTPVAAGTATITVTVSDGTASPTDTFVVTVNKAVLTTPVVTISAQDGKLTATWPNVANAASYEVEYKQSTSETWLGNDDDTSPAEIDSLANGTEYDVRVRAKATSSSTTHEDSAWSEVKKGTPAAVDVAPSFGSATIAAQSWTVDTSVSLTLPAATGGNGTISYELTPALPSGVSLNASTRVVSGAPTAVASVATYTWRAKDSDSNTANTDTASLTFSVTVGKGTLATPTNLALKANTQRKTSFTVSWTAVTNATGYTATATPSGGTAVTGAVTGTEATFTGLTAGTTYTVSVVATGNTANYENSTAAMLNQATAANVAPSIVDITNKTATFGTNLLVDVDATDTNPEDTLQYQASSGAEAVATVSPTSLTDLGTSSQITVTPVAAGTATITVTVSDGTASPTDTFVVTVNKAVLTTPVVTVSAQDGKLTATWPDVANAASYEVEYKQSTSETWLGNDDDTSPAEIDSLTNGTEYDVRVRAKATSSSTTHEDSAWSEVKKGTPAAVDVVPSFGSATIAAQSWTVDTSVSLTLPAATGGNGTISYELTPALPSGVSLNASTRVVSGAPTAVASAATYTWRAKDSDSNTANTDTASLTFSVTVGKGTLATPTNLALKANTQRKTSFTVSWTAVTNATGYTATATPSGGTAVTGTVTGTEATFTGLTAGTTYTVSVVATGNTANYENSTAATLSQATAANVAPSIVDITNKTATFGTNLLVDVDATDTNPEDTLQYRASSGAEAVATVSPTSLTDLGTSSQITVTPVAAGTATITVTVSDGTASPTDTFVVTVNKAVLTTPVVTISAQDGKLTATWPNVANAASYEVEYKQSTSETWLGNDDDTSPAEIDSLTNGTEYDVRVRAKATSSSTTHEDSAWSEVKKGTPAAVDVVPSFGSATIAAQSWTVDTSVSLTLPAATGGNGTISYELTPALPSGVSLNASTRVVSGAPTAVASAATYTWRAKDSDSNTANTDTASLTFSLTVGKGTLATPANLALKANTQRKTSFTVSWTAVTNATGYTATATPSGGTAVTGAVTGTEATFTGLTAGTTYTVSVVATGNTANYENSTAAMLNQATAANVAPSIVDITNKTATFGTNLLVDVDATDTNPEDTLQYQASSGAEAVATVSPTSLTDLGTSSQITVTPVAAGTATITVTVSDGTASPTDTFVVTVNKAVLTTPVVTISAQDGKLTATWPNVANAASYEVEYKQSTSETWLGNDDDTSPAEIDSLANGTEYDVRVRAKATSSSTTHEDSAWSEVKKGTPAAVDVAPSFGSATIAAQSWTVDTSVSLTLPAATGGNGTISYELTPALPSGVSLNASTRVVSGAPTAVASVATYTWRAKDSDSNTANTDTASLTFSVTVGKGTLATPTNLALKANTQRKTSFTVSWTAVTNATGYTATATPSGGTAVTGAVTGTEATFTGLTAGTTYTVSVVATGNTANYENSTAATLSQATAANVAPSIVDITNKTATFGTNLLVDVDATDTNPEDTLQYQASSGAEAVATVSPTSLTDLGTSSQITVTPVAAGTATITVTVSDGTASPTDTFVVTVNKAVLTTPVVTISAQDGKLTATWPNVANAASYEVEYKQSTSETWLGNDDDTSPAEIDSLTNGTEYDVRVRAKATSSSTTHEDSAWSEVKKGTPAAVDVVPSFGSATIAAQSWTVDTSVSLTLPAATGGNGTISYELTPALPSGVSLNASTRVVSGAPTAVASAATYTWRAKDSDSNTANTDTASLTFSVTVGKGTLATPTNLALKANTQRKTSFTVSWTAVTNATGYTATATPSGGTAVTGAVTGTEATFTGLTAGTTYTVSVVATGNTANYENSTAATLSQATAANVAPSIVDITNKTATFGTNLLVDVDATDTNPEDTLQYQASSGAEAVATVSPTSLTDLGTSSQITVTPVAAGTATITVTVSDGTASPTDTFVVTVNKAVLTTPVVTISAQDGKLTASWPDVANAASYEVEYKQSTSETWLGNDDDTSPAEIDSLTNGTEYDVRVRAKATSSSTTHEDSAWSEVKKGTPAAVDVVPSFGSATIAAQSWTVDTSVSLTLPAATGGNGTISYELTPALPSGVSLNASTRVVSGAPTAVVSVATYTWRAKDSDSNTADTDTVALTFQLTVNKAKLAKPTNLVLKANSKTRTGFTVTFDAVSNAAGYTATAVATSGTSVTVTLSTAPANPEAVFTGLEMNTTYTVTVVATGNANYTDSDASDGLSVTTLTNQVPAVANEIPDQAATVGTAFEYVFPSTSFSDADSDSLTYEAKQTDGTTDSALPGWLMFIAPERKLAGTPQAANIGTLMVKVTASDSNGGSISDTFNIIVSTTTANQAPTVANMIPDQSATVDTEFSFNVPANTFSDADGDTLTYSATKADDMALPAWLTFNPDARTFSGTPTSTDTGTLMVKVTVSDGMGGLISDTFNIIVSTTTANQEVKEKLEGVNKEITPSIVNEVVGRQMASITDRFATISSGFHMGSLSMEEVVTDVADYLFSHHQDIQANGFDWRQALSGHNFSFALADTTSVSQGSMDDGESSSSGSGPVSFWGGIDYSSLEDRIEPFSLNGDIMSFNFGVDKEFTSDLVAGVLLSIANSEFELAEDSTDSTYEVDIFTVNPYISWEASDELSLWASVGYGWGQTDLTDDSTDDTFSQGDNFTRFSAGGRFQLWSSEAGTALALKLDGATAHFLGADVQNSRLATEISHDFSMDSAVLNTALELGLLMSSVDTSAAELIGRLHWQGDAGFSASAQSRVLLGGGDRQEWGIGGALRYTTAAEGEREGEGLVVSLEPSFGISNPQLLSELWSATRLDLAVTREAPPAQLNVKLAYGFPTSDGLLTPYTDLSFSETTNTYVTGLRYGLPTGWNLNLKGMHKTSTTDAENTILLELRSDL